MFVGHKCFYDWLSLWLHWMCLHKAFVNMGCCIHLHALDSFNGRILWLLIYSVVWVHRQNDESHDARGMLHLLSSQGVPSDFRPDESGRCDASYSDYFSRLLKVACLWRYGTDFLPISEHGSEPGLRLPLQVNSLPCSNLTPTLTHQTFLHCIFYSYFLGMLFQKGVTCSRNQFA